MSTRRDKLSPGRSVKASTNLQQPQPMERWRTHTPERRRGSGKTQSELNHIWPSTALRRRGRVTRRMKVGNWPKADVEFSPVTK